MHSNPRFLQGIFEFTGQGWQKPFLLDPALAYVVPAGLTAQPLYFRGGNSADEMVTVVLMRDGSPMRLFPVGARGDAHVPLRVVEDLLSDTRLEVHVAAAEGSAGVLAIDLGLVEI